MQFNNEQIHTVEMAIRLAYDALYLAAIGNKESNENATMPHYKAEFLALSEKQKANCEKFNELLRQINLARVDLVA